MTESAYRVVKLENHLIIQKKYGVSYRSILPISRIHARTIVKLSTILCTPIVFHDLTIITKDYNIFRTHLSL